MENILTDGYCLSPYTCKCCTVFKQFDRLNFDSLAGKCQKRQNSPPPRQNFPLYDTHCSFDPPKVHCKVIQSVKSSSLFGIAEVGGCCLQEWDINTQHDYNYIIILASYMKRRQCVYINLEYIYINEH